MARDVRVILASEHAATRRLISDAIEDEGEIVIIGQAENAAKAMMLARNLRPDIALIDSWLPHMAGMDGAPMTRISGLDTAQTISLEMPNTRVILLNNLDTDSVSDPFKRATKMPSFSQKIVGGHQSLSLKQLYRETVPLMPPLFAQVLLREDATGRAEGLDLSDKAVVFGGFGILFGLCLVLTIAFAGVGVVLAMLGVALLVTGFTGKLVRRLWRNSKNRHQNPAEVIETSGGQS